MHMANLEVSEIRSAIQAAGQNWRAADNPVSRLEPEAQRRRLGLAVPPGEKERIAAAMAEASHLRGAMAYATERDWRSKDGANFVTPIRDQGNCGSCVSFATVATIESQARIEHKAPTWELNLSEAELFFCGGATCANGWWPKDAVAYAKNKGIGDESCMPYSDHDQACNISSDKPDKMLKIGDSQEIAGIEQRKGWLDTNGPMVACLAIYDDFFAYADGIYRHATGELAGYHAVSCVGYNENEGYWLCKNSWGESWGDGGFFKIAYGEAEIDTSFAMYGVAEITGTLKPDATDADTGTDSADYVVVQSNPQADVLFAHVKGKWRAMPLTDGRVIDITEAAFAAEQITVTYEGERILALSSWKKLKETSS
jgi:hypothetical protein